VTNDLIRRAHEHRTKFYKKSFSAQYNINRLVYFEEYDDIYLAIQREKNIKRYYRQWKINLIESMNPAWDDLYFKLF